MRPAFTLPDGRQIVTEYWRKPGPTDRWDWSAVTDDYDGAPDTRFKPIGYGATEDEAICDLQEQIEMRESEAKRAQPYQ